MGKTTTTEKRDLYAEVTDSIVAAMERAGEWERPWTSVENGAAFPRNADGRAYRGVNTILLWAAAMDHGYASGIWATYKSWAGRGAQVRKGEKGTLVTLWRPFDRKATAEEIAAGKDTDGKMRGLLLRHFTVFAAEQVDGYEVPEATPMPEPQRDAIADAWFAGLGGDVRYGGDQAFYSTATDRITLPDRAAFTTAERFYATLAHEYGHWTGHASRLDRNLSGRFGSEAYAAEELVAELTAAFVGAMLGFHTQVRDDHASYVKNWVEVLRNDKRAIFTAASLAQKAADYLAGTQADEDATITEEAA